MLGRGTSSSTCIKRAALRGSAARLLKCSGETHRTCDTLKTRREGQDAPQSPLSSGVYSSCRDSTDSNFTLNFNLQSFCCRCIHLQRIMRVKTATPYYQRKGATIQNWKTSFPA
ncbi:hypothetical protein SRHO_G00234860 [Serrasalmus rhombeus]